MIGLDVLVRLVGEARFLDRLWMIGLDVLVRLVSETRLLDRLLGRFEMWLAIAAGAGPVNLRRAIPAVASDRWGRAIAAVAGDRRRRGRGRGRDDDLRRWYR